MSIESKIMPRVTSMMMFVKDQVKSNLVEANNKKILNLSEIELEKIANIVTLSIDSAYYKGMSEIINEVKKIET